QRADGGQRRTDHRSRDERDRGGSRREREHKSELQGGLHRGNSNGARGRWPEKTSSGSYRASAVLLRNARLWPVMSAAGMTHHVRRIHARSDFRIRPASAMTPTSNASPATNVRAGPRRMNGATNGSAS